MQQSIRGFVGRTSSSSGSGGSVNEASTNPRHPYYRLLRLYLEVYLPRPGGLLLAGGPQGTQGGAGGRSAGGAAAAGGGAGAGVGGGLTGLLGAGGGMVGALSGLTVNTAYAGG